MIRAARPDDMSALLRMGAAFHGESKWATTLAPFHADSFAATCTILGRDGGLLVAEEGGKPVGMVGGAVVPLYFNAGVPVAQEVFWYAQPEHRRGVGMALLDALEGNVRDRRARGLMVSALEALRGEAVSALFGRRGYAPAERTFAKVF